jgi:hypothetical protein
MLHVIIHKYHPRENEGILDISRVLCEGKGRAFAHLLESDYLHATVSYYLRLLEYTRARGRIRETNPSMSALKISRCFVKLNETIVRDSFV